MHKPGNNVFLILVFVLPFAIIAFPKGTMGLMEWLFTGFYFGLGAVAVVLAGIEIWKSLFAKMQK